MVCHPLLREVNFGKREMFVHEASAHETCNLVGELINAGKLCLKVEATERVYLWCSYFVYDSFGCTRGEKFRSGERFTRNFPNNLSAFCIFAWAMYNKKTKTFSRSLFDEERKFYMMHSNWIMLLSSMLFCSLFIWIWASEQRFGKVT